MSRLIFTAAAAAMGASLAGCSGSSLSMPDWLTLKPPGPPLQALQFESEPPGAEVRTAQGQSCRTPCSLTVPLQSQSVTFAMDGYLSQTAQVDVHQPAERSPDNIVLPPDFIPNPLDVALEAAPPPIQPARPQRPRGTVPRAKSKTAAPAPRQVPAGAVSAPPSTQQPVLSPFPSSR